MGKRIAFIGLSTPLFYDYRNPASKAISDLGSSPNPILDSPFGLFLLFDEIWFLCRSLCPQNMRDLPYVKFLDESGKLPLLKNIEDRSKNILGTIEEDPAFFKRHQKYYDSLRFIEQQLGELGFTGMLLQIITLTD